MFLALDVGISSKHLSFVETGRSQPSRELVLKLAHALDLPYRHRNAFLNAAGYAPAFDEVPFDGQKMEIVRSALQRMLEKHEPYPALVMTAGYQILMANSGFERVIRFYLGEDALDRYDNIYWLTFSPDGLRQHIIGWPMIEQFMLDRLWEEAASTQSRDLLDLHGKMSGMASGRLAHRTA
mgnify:FL=1